MTTLTYNGNPVVGCTTTLDDDLPSWDEVRAYVSRLWAEDWNSPGDEAFDVYADECDNAPWVMGNKSRGDA